MKKSTNDVTYEVTYTGGLSTTKDVYLHYGYENWSDISEKKMRNLKSSCKVEITLPENQELNFCFRDSQNNWDNNYGNDYYFVPNSNLTYGFINVAPKAMKTSKSSVTAKKVTDKSTTKTSMKSATKSVVTTKKSAKKSEK